MNLYLLLFPCCLATPVSVRFLQETAVIYASSPPGFLTLANVRTEVKLQCWEVLLLMFLFVLQRSSLFGPPPDLLPLPPATCCFCNKSTAPPDSRPKRTNVVKSKNPDLLSYSLLFMQGNPSPLGNFSRIITSRGFLSCC